MNYQDVLSLIPDYWSPMGADVRYYAVPLPIFSSEYNEVKSRLQGRYYFQTSEIYRVQNPMLWAKFLLKKDEYFKQGNAEIKTLFHDTPNHNVDSICEYNLMWRKGERFMFGPGVYFSIHPDIAVKHSAKKNCFLRAMFVVDVLMKHVQVVNEEVFLPKFGYDTVLAHGGQTYVKYFDGEFYPRYFMTYSVSKDSLYDSYYPI